VVYGYGGDAINEHGLREMREVSLFATVDTLRELASFILDTADELQSADVSASWHSRGI
jgi:hypothetical protein